MYYDMQIIENGKVRYIDAYGCTPGGALNQSIKAAHIRKSAIVRMGSAGWFDGEYVASTVTYQHLKERDTDRYSAWQLVGTDCIEWMCSKPY